MAIAIVLTVMGSTNADPKQFTTANPTYTRYYTVSHIVSFGDLATASTVGGAAGLGVVNVSYTSNNALKNEQLYVTINGAAIAALVNA